MKGKIKTECRCWLLKEPYRWNYAKSSKHGNQMRLKSRGKQEFNMRLIDHIKWFSFHNMLCLHSTLYTHTQSVYIRIKKTNFTFYSWNSMFITGLWVTTVRWFHRLHWKINENNQIFYLHLTLLCLSCQQNHKLMLLILLLYNIYDFDCLFGFVYLYHLFT